MSTLNRLHDHAVFKRLLLAAFEGETVTLQELNDAVRAQGDESYYGIAGYELTDTGMFAVLDRITQWCVDNSHPILSCLVTKVEDGLPGVGFWPSLEKALGKTRADEYPPEMQRYVINNVLRPACYNLYAGVSVTDRVFQNQLTEKREQVEDFIRGRENIERLPGFDVIYPVAPLERAYNRVHRAIGKKCVHGAIVNTGSHNVCRAALGAWIEEHTLYNELGNFIGYKTEIITDDSHRYKFTRNVTLPIPCNTALPDHLERYLLGDALLTASIESVKVVGYIPDDGEPVFNFEKPDAVEGLEGMRTMAIQATHEHLCIVGNIDKERMSARLQVMGAVDADPDQYKGKVVLEVTLNAPGYGD